MIFEIDNIELYFFEKQILNGVYLKAETGKVTGILGSNGSGKSSLLQIFFGKLEARHKLIRIDNKVFLKAFYTSGMVRYLPQDPFLPKDLKLTSVFDFYGVSWKEFVNDFNSFAEYKKNKVRDLSGGELRLIETYLVIKNTAEIILLDEPFTHLSPVNINKFKNIIEEEKVNKAIVISDHMFRHIISVADDLYLLNNGCTQLVRDIHELEEYHYLNFGTL